MPVVDVIAVILIGITIFRAYRKGVIKEIFVILRLLLVFFITMLSYEKLAVAFQAAVSKMPTWGAKMLAFSIILVPISISVWFIKVIIQGKMEKQAKDVSVTSGIIGGILGLLRGIFIVSLIFMFSDFYKTESRDTPIFGNTISHRIIGNIAPGMKNFVFGIFSHSEDNGQKDTANQSEN